MRQILPNNTRIKFQLRKSIATVWRNNDGDDDDDNENYNDQNYDDCSIPSKHALPAQVVWFVVAT